MDEFTSERLLKTNEKFYLDVLLILDDLTDLIMWKTKSEATDLDDLMAFHLNLSTTLTTHHHLGANHSNSILGEDDTGESGKSFQEKLAKKFQIIQDEAYWREFQMKLKT